MHSRLEPVLSQKWTIYSNNRGVALVVALLLLAALALLGTTAFLFSTTETKIGNNYRSSEQALYVAEAGIQEALYRLRLFDDNTQAPPSGSMIVVNGLSNNNAHISIDPNGLLTDVTDDDGNGVIDDVSDLNFNGAYDNRTWMTKIMLTTSEPYTDTQTTIYTPTIQPSGSWLQYSSATADGTELTIEFKKDIQDMDGDGNTSEIVFYDAALSNPYNVETTTTHASGTPVLVITSTGRSNGSMKEIQIEAVRQPLAITGQASIEVNAVPTVAGNVLISGFNHEASTSPDDSGTMALTQFNSNGIDNHGGKEGTQTDTDANLSSGSEETDYETDIPYGAKVKSSGHKPGLYLTGGSFTLTGSTEVYGGDGATPWLVQTAAPAWSSLADALGVSQETVDSILAGANVTVADMDASGKLTVKPQGIIYINNAGGGNTLKITSSTPGYDGGWGLMYVTGNADFQNLTFKGLIYIEGDTSISGNFWILGAMAVKGSASADFQVNKGTFLYSDDVLKTMVNRGMGYTILAWREVLAGD